MKKVYVFLFDGYSDWEIAYLAPEIHKSQEFELVYFSGDGRPVTSMGGLNVTPNVSLHDVDAGEVSLLVLPGGTAWEKGGNTEVEALTRAVFEQGKTVAAICAATTFLGRLGLLDRLRHTSADPNYLKAFAPGYCGEAYYQYDFAVTDGNLITANGIASIEFAREIFRTLGLFGVIALEKWFQLFKNGVWSE